MGEIHNLIAVFLFAYAISDYINLQVEVFISGIVLIVLGWYFLPVATAAPLAAAVFVVAMILLGLRHKWTLAAAIALIPVSMWYMFQVKDPRVSGLLWMLIGATIGIIDNVYLKTTAPGDIMVTIVLFLAAGPLALPIYVAQTVYGQLFLERKEGKYSVYPMGTAVFIGYLALAWAVDKLMFIYPWILP